MEKVIAGIVCLFNMYNEIVPFMKVLLFVKMYVYTEFDQSSFKHF